MNHKAKKRFGQNFLHDQTIIDRIIQCISPLADDRMVEIGPGLGALTIPLLDKLDKLDVIELDRDIIPRLQASVASHDATAASRLQIHEADVLKFDFAEMHQQNAASPRLRVVGNLPYNISTPILFHLLKYRDMISDMHFMLQKEVVDRICSAPGSKSYGRLGVMLQTYCQADYLLEVPPGAFTPAPKVTSAIVRLVPRPAQDIRVHNFREFEKLVQAAFAQRRKTLRNTLRPVCTAEQISKAGFDPSARAESLSVADFSQLFASLN